MINLSSTTSCSYGALSKSQEMPTEENIKISVSYSKLRREHLIEAIRKVENPQVIIWYIGIYGLCREGMNYYRKDLSKIYSTSNAECSLYDMTAWAPFAPKETKCSVQDFNGNANLINQFAIPRIQCLKSCDFFNWLREERFQKKMEDLKAVLKRPFIYEKSKEFPDAKSTIGDIFQRQCPLLEDIYDINAAKGYSALQYLEGIYLIQKIVNDTLYLCFAK
jgi:hypothetical protein